jgi:hypothetical protein
MPDARGTAPGPQRGPGAVAEVMALIDGVEKEELSAAGR